MTETFLDDRERTRSLQANSTTRTRLSRELLAIVATTIAIYAYFVGGYVNSVRNNAIADLTLAIVDDGAIHIDRYAANSNDIATNNDHFYSGFGPGLSFALVPIYLGIKPAVELLPDAVLERTDRLLNTRIEAKHTHLKPADSRTKVLLVILAGTLFLAIPLGVFTMLRLLAVVRRMLPELSSRDVCWIAGVFTFGTIAMSYSTNLAHTAVAAFAIWIAVSLVVERGHQLSPRAALVVGMLLGVAPTVDYPAVLYSGLAGAFVLVTLSSDSRLRTGATVALGAAIPGAACLAYHWSAFGQFLTNPYRFRVRAVDQGIFDISKPSSSLPDLEKVGAGLFSPNAGIVLYHPLLIVGVASCLWLVAVERDRVRRALWGLGAMTMLANIAVYCSYPTAVGPASAPTFGIRYTVYSVPYALAAIAGLLHRFPSSRGLRVGLTLVAVLNAVPVWLYALYGAPIWPGRDYWDLVSQVGPANYTLTKLHEAGIVHSTLWAWGGASVTVALLVCWFRIAWRQNGRAFLAQPG